MQSYGKLNEGKSSGRMIRRRRIPHRRLTRIHERHHAIIPAKNPPRPRAEKEGTARRLEACTRFTLRNGPFGPPRRRDRAGRVVPAGTLAMVRSPDSLRAPEGATALSTLIRQRHLTPSCGGHAPTAERTVGPARMIVESLTPRPGIREHYRGISGPMLLERGTPSICAFREVMEAGALINVATASTWWMYFATSRTSWTKLPKAPKQVTFQCGSRRTIISRSILKLRETSASTYLHHCSLAPTRPLNE